MATENRTRFNKTTAPGLFAYGKKEFKKYPDEWKQLVSMRTSSRSYEESTFGSGFGYLALKPEGSPVTYDARIEGPTKRWVHDAYALGARITHEAIEDDMQGFMRLATRDLMSAAAGTRHLLVARLFMNGTNTTYHTAGDTLAIFSASHTNLNGGTFSNLFAAADPSEASVTAAIKNFESITDHRGKRYDQNAEYIWCGPSHEFAFSKILGSTLEPESNNNAINPIPKNRKLKLVIDGEITDDRWGVGGRKDDEVGLIYFDREKPSIKRSPDADTGDSKFIVYMRMSLEANDPRQLAMVNIFT